MEKLSFDSTLILLQRDHKNLHPIEDFQSNFFISLKIFQKCHNKLQILEKNQIQFDTSGSMDTGCIFKVIKTEDNHCLVTKKHVVLA